MYKYVHIYIYIYIYSIIFADKSLLGLPNKINNKLLLLLIALFVVGREL